MHGEDRHENRESESHVRQGTAATSQDAERSLHFSQPTIVWIKITDLPYRCSTEVVGPP